VPHARSPAALLAGIVSSPTRRPPRVGGAALAGGAGVWRSRRASATSGRGQGLLLPPRVFVQPAFDVRRAVDWRPRAPRPRCGACPCRARAAGTPRRRASRRRDRPTSATCSPPAFGRARCGALLPARVASRAPAPTRALRVSRRAPLLAARSRWCWRCWHRRAHRRRCRSSNRSAARDALRRLLVLKLTLVLAALAGRARTGGLLPVWQATRSRSGARRCSASRAPCVKAVCVRGLGVVTGWASPPPEHEQPAGVRSGCARRARRQLMPGPRPRLVARSILG